LITQRLLAACSDLPQIECGLAHFFLQHTSASLTLNENTDPDVRLDLEMATRRLCPEDGSYRHACEGPDDMPAHVKASLLGSSLLIPIRGGRLALGTWQGIYLCEHRQRGGERQVVITLFGQPF
jgi:secondary thiamine-phosphate synthase enzyme